MQIIWKCNIDESKRFIRAMNERWAMAVPFVPNVGDDVVLSTNTIAGKLDLRVVHRTLLSPLQIEVELWLSPGWTVGRFNEFAKQF